MQEANLIGKIWLMGNFVTIVMFFMVYNIIVLLPPQIYLIWDFSANIFTSSLSIPLWILENLTLFLAYMIMAFMATMIFAYPKCFPKCDLKGYFRASTVNTVFTYFILFIISNLISTFIIIITGYHKQMMEMVYYSIWNYLAHIMGTGLWLSFVYLMIFNGSFFLFLIYRNIKKKDKRLI